MEQHLESESTVNTVPLSSSELSKGGGTVAPETQDVTSEHHRDSAFGKSVTMHQLPIPPASEPMQYRAIGLIKGTYIPSEDQFTRGQLMTDDNQPIDAVLLGRVMSLVKKHVDLTIPHLWVVYPRTRPKNEHLHAQIVGIWEPDNLHQDNADEESEGHSGDELGNPFESTEPTSAVPVETEELQKVTEGASEVGNETDSGTTGQLEEGVMDNIDNTIDVPGDLVSKSNDLTTSDAYSGSEQSEQNESELIQEKSHLTPIEEPGPQDLGQQETGQQDMGTVGSTVASKLVKPVRPKFAATAVKATNKASMEAIAQKPLRPDTSEKTDKGSTAEKLLPSTPLKDGYFSIRGEVLQFSPDTQEITVRIRQASRKSVTADDQAKEDKEFKLQLQGLLKGRVIGYFWEFHVQRQGNILVIDEANMIGIVPPRKNRRKKVGGKGGGRSGIRRRPEGGRSDYRPTRSGDRSTPAPSRRGASSKPVLKKSSSPSSDSNSNSPKAES